jgi:hypothetical protein
MALRRTLALAASLGLAFGGAAAAATSASASTPLVTASTIITNNPDSGGDGAWAYDDFTRTLTISTDTSSDCASLTGWETADSCYTAEVTDTGTAATIVGAFQPNQGTTVTADQTAGKVTGPREQVPFSGSASYQFYAPRGIIPSAAVVPANRDNDFTAQTGAFSMSSWFLQAFTSAGQEGVYGQIGDWSWTYKNSCEKWTDASTNNGGQSTPLADDGNITGKVCPVSTTSPSGPGDVINQFGNGLDANRQDRSANTKIIAWPVKASDPAVDFEAITSGAGVAFEYAPGGRLSGLCVSEAVGSEPAGSAPTGLVERSCNGSGWQRFAVNTARNGSFQLVNVATGNVIQPTGTGGQFTGATKVTNVAGSWFGWNARGAVPAS